MQVVSCDFKKINLRVASSFLRVANIFCGLEIKLRVASYFLQVTSYKFKEIILRVASCALWAENLKKLFKELPVAFHELKV